MLSNNNMFGYPKRVPKTVGMSFSTDLTMALGDALLASDSANGAVAMISGALMNARPAYC